MRRYLLTICVALAMLGWGTQAAAAEGAIVITDSIHNYQLTEIVRGEPCNVPDGTVTHTANGVFHTTVRPNGSVLVESSISDNFTYVPLDPAAGPSYTGHQTVHYAVNTTVADGTFMFVNPLRATGSDGSVLQIHMVQRGTVDANGNVTSFTFDKIRCN